jgi:hypothetical protein
MPAIGLLPAGAAPIGAPFDVPPIAKHRSLKLLDCIVCLAQLAGLTGLDLSKNGSVLWDRLINEGTEPTQPIAHLFALHDVRILNAHDVDDRNKRPQEELKRFGVTAGEETAGYGQILDRIYDLLLTELNEAADKFNDATSSIPLFSGVLSNKRIKTGERNPPIDGEDRHEWPEKIEYWLTV